jgi:ribonuclease HI
VNLTPPLMPSTGIVVRDSDGRVLLSAWSWLKHCASPEAAETEACLQGVRLINEWIKQPTEVEMDCQALVRCLTRATRDRAAWAGVVEEIRAACNLLPQFRVMHTYREANRIAHELAKMGLQKQACGVLRFNTPEEVRILVQVEAVATPEGVQACNPSFCD